MRQSGAVREQARIDPGPSSFISLGNLIGFCRNAGLLNPAGGMRHNVEDELLLDHALEQVCPGACGKADILAA